MNLSSISFNQKSLNANLSSLKLQGSQKSRFGKATKALMKKASNDKIKNSSSTVKADKGKAPQKKGGSVFDFITKKIQQNKKIIKPPLPGAKTEGKKEEKKSAGSKRKGVNLAALRGRNKTFVVGSKKKKKRRIK